MKINQCMRIVIISIPLLIITSCDIGRVAALRWVAPDARENGDNLYEYQIAHYRVLHEFNGKIETIDHANSPKIFLNLETGTHFFSVSAVDTEGVVGEYSARVSKVIKSKAK